MSKKSPRRGKHVPQRTCVGCRETLAKRALIRVVRGTEGVRLDLSGKMPGRGAYLHDRVSCWERGLKGALPNALRTDLSKEEREAFLEFMQTLPAEKNDEE